MPNAKTTSTLEKNPSPLTRRVAMIVLIAVVIVGGIFVVGRAANLFLVLFAGVLAATFLDGLSDQLVERTPLGRKAALAVVVIALVITIGISGWLLAPSLSKQAGQLGSSLQTSVQDLGDRLGQTRWGDTLMKQIPSANELISGGGGIADNLTGVVSAVFNSLTNIILIIFFAIYFALTPDLYMHGVLRLIPRDKRRRGDEVINRAGVALRWWLIGRFLSMLVVGILTTIGLLIIGVPLALVLGVIAGLLAFVPVIGPIVAAVPPILIALTNGTQQALYVVILFLIIQTLESYIITPLIQQRTVSLPPVLTIGSQVFFGTFFGLLGIALANPITVVVMVLIQMIYVQDMLGDESVEVLIEDSEAS